jgi:hypothetical protein
MAGKKKTKKKPTRSKSAARNGVRPTKKLAKKAAIPKKKSAKRKPGQRKAAVKTKAVAKKTTVTKRRRVPKRGVQRESQIVQEASSSVERSRARSGGQSGDLQGMSNSARADSESVDELLEEGNAFEADAVAGVEQAGDADEAEVRTHEVPEDDVPEEYLDKDEL